MKRPIDLPSPLLPMIETLRRRGVRPVVVGGYVRDALLGIACKDIDIECFGIGSLDALAALLAPFGRAGSVGSAFGVLKLQLPPYEIDLSLPRTETKTGGGHTGFAVQTFSRFDFETAARRRDFTVNAIGYDPAEQRLLDPYRGEEDLKRGILRCVAPETFVEDPLRLLRAVQFSARFALAPDKELLELAHKMMDAGVLDELPKERIFEELKKLLLKSDTPSRGLRTMDALRITPFFPQLDALKARRSDGTHDTAWHQTQRALDAMAALRKRLDAEPLALMLGVLCLETEDAAAFLAQITDDKRLTRAALAYASLGNVPDSLYAKRASDAEIMRLACRVRIDAVAAVAAAVHRGRHPRAGRAEAAEWLLGRAEALGVLKAPRPALLDGKTLIDEGLAPSPRFKSILDAAYEAQLEGRFSDKAGAKKWLETYRSDLGKS